LAAHGVHTLAAHGKLMEVAYADGCIIGQSSGLEQPRAHTRTFGQSSSMEPVPCLVLLPWQLQTGVLVRSPCTQSRHGGFIFWPVQSRAQYLNSFPHQLRTDTLAGSGCTLASLGSTSLAFAVVRKRMFLGVARAHNPGLEEAQYFTRFRRGSEATWPSYHAPAGRA